MAEAFGGRLANLDVVMQTRSTETIKQAVVAGLGISFLSAHTVQLERRVGQLAVLDYGVSHRRGHQPARQGRGTVASRDAVASSG